MVEIHQKITSAIENENPLEALEKLVYQLKSEAMDRDSIYAIFHEYHVLYQYTENWIETEKKFIDHPVDLTLDRIWGFCPKGLEFDLD